MITIIQRPLGFKLSGSGFANATITNSGGNALVTAPFTHALVTGNYVFIRSNFSSYSGGKYVTVVSPTTYLIGDDAFSFVPYIQDADIQYDKSIYTNNVIAVHNPIVYEMESTLFPTNTEEDDYVPAVVDSHSNANGYTRLILSGNLSDATALSWIQIGGVKYQIITAESDSIVVINHAYDASDSFDGPVTKYYNNYCINVVVKCGFYWYHRWYDQKPFTYAATLKFTPDSNNRIKFSISEIVKSFITTRNKLDLDTLPNNIDFATLFYIVYYESWDESDDTEITTHNETQISDYNEYYGMAVNAKMPFKSQAGAFMSDYISGSDNAYLAKWLVLQDTMVWIVGKFMDLSFIMVHSETDAQILVNGELYATYENVSIGVIRVALQFDTAGQYCVQAIKPASGGSPETVNDVTGDVPAVADWYNISRGFTPWTIDVQPDVALAYTGLGIEQSDYLAFDFPFVPGREYQLTIRFAVGYSGSGHSNPRGYVIHVMDDAGVIQFGSSGTYLSSPGGFFNVTITFTANPNCTKVGTYFNAGIFTSIGTPIRTFTFDGVPTTDYELIETTPAQAPTAQLTLTEPYCITVVEECDDTIVPVVDDIRLLEDGSYRLLE